MPGPLSIDELIATDDSFSAEELVRLPPNWVDKFFLVAGAAKAYAGGNWRDFDKAFRPEVINRLWANDGNAAMINASILEFYQEDNIRQAWRVLNDTNDPARYLLWTAADVWLTQFSKDCPGYEYRHKPGPEWDALMLKIRNSLQVATGDGVVKWDQIWRLPH